uniref:Occludin b n=1 Tax=Nothobranchius furzeri TaxID=105023 RepID=A0A8C6MF01_NOTFU
LCYYKCHISRHRHSELMSNPAVSYYHTDKMLHFYRWTSPPGVMKIMSIIIIIMCVAVFACVASTLAWDYDMSMMGGTGLMPGYGASGSLYGNSYGSSYGGYGGTYGGYGSGIGGSYGYGGTQVDPVSGKGFLIAIAAITFIAVLVVFILVVSKQSAAHSQKFYLGTIIICAILALLMLIAAIVYLVAVNPTAQTSGSMMYNQMIQLCAQYQNQNQAQGLFINQYLYHYCVVDPQEAVAIVLSFLVCVALIILLVFAVKTRSLICRWGPERILWEEVKVINAGPQNSVGEWVSRVFLPPKTSSRLDSDISSFVGGVNSKLKDYDTGVESGDDLDENDFSVLFPPIVDEQERLAYKREFDQEHVEYKNLQAELDAINQDLAEADRELDRHSEGSPQFLDALNEYTELKNLKKTPDYQSKKRRCKHLRSKLSHIKRMISDYDRRP